MQPTRDPHQTSALVAGVAAFVTWGLVPIYWKLLRFIPASEILAHRFVWTCVFMVVLLSWQKRWPEVLGNLRTPRTALLCAGSARQEFLGDWNDGGIHEEACLWRGDDAIVRRDRAYDRRSISNGPRPSRRGLFRGNLENIDDAE